ncbi:MAG: 2-C-methyl-D-erythritol 4-phosphate cytidylyltransferase [Melioribacteraceae bacterium]|nr:2-C-methyl-D-erythritol 4-phosphate cytidylyltransferase [Melioribacteraceae bacterium]
MKIHAIIPSGGSGTRTSHQIPKQYLEFGGKEMIAFTIEVFQKCNLIDDIIIVAKPEYFNLIEQIKSKYSFSKILRIVEGGNERQHSVFNGLKSISADSKDLIVVHDAARPLLTVKLLERAVKSAKIYDNVVVALKARDTLIKGSDTVDSYLDRTDIFYAQTPQIFRYDILMESMRKAESERFLGTDESMLVQKAFYQVKIVEGSPLNFKVTSDEDIKIFKSLIE